jgi:hypothetical protein
MKACATASSIWTPADVEAIDAAALGQDLAVAMIPRREIASAIVRVQAVSATTSRLRPARPHAQRCARGAAMWRNPCCHRSGW